MHAKSIERLVDYVRQDQAEKLPLDMEIRDGLDENGEWQTNFVVFVVSDKLRISEVSKMRKWFDLISV